MSDSSYGVFMVPTKGKGKELQDLLRKELGIPEYVRWFEVRFAIDDPVIVRCEYTPKETR